MFARYDAKWYCTIGVGLHRKGHVPTTTKLRTTAASTTITIHQASNTAIHTWLLRSFTLRLVPRAKSPTILNIYILYISYIYTVYILCIHHEAEATNKLSTTLHCASAVLIYLRAHYSVLLDRVPASAYRQSRV